MSATQSEFESLHRLRIRSLTPREMFDDIDDLAQRGLVVVTPRGCLLSPEGMRRHAVLLEQWRETIDLALVASTYERFLAVNQPVKDLCSRWQSQSQDDDEALFMVVEDLAEIVDRAGAALGRAAQAAPRFGTYGPRLQRALEAAREGDTRFITDPRVDSVHNVWFECHEDYLLTLGRDREQEGSF